jgi:hypothetical protein
MVLEMAKICTKKRDQEASMRHNCSDVVTPVRIIPECHARIGILETVELERGATIAQIDGRRYEAPSDMLDEFRGLVGQLVIIACIAGQVRVGIYHDRH